MAIVEIKNWCTSAEGQAIRCLKSTVLPKNPILLIGGVHGDEPEGVELATATLNWLTEITSENQNKVSPWIVIPCLNPDGFRKNQRTNGNNVDLNRNYPSKNWSPEYSQSRYHPGKKPASEPEIQALVNLIATYKPKIIIHCHSWNPCIVYTGEPGRKYAEALGESSGYELRDDIGYPTPGSLSQYGWVDNKIPIICIEEQEKVELSKVWPHFAAGMNKIFCQIGLDKK